MPCESTLPWLPPQGLSVPLLWGHVMREPPRPSQNRGWISLGGGRGELAI